MSLAAQAAPRPLTPPGAVPCRLLSRRPGCLLSPEHWLPLSLRHTRCRPAAAMWLLPAQRAAHSHHDPTPNLCRRHSPAGCRPSACSAAGSPSGVPPSGAVGPTAPVARCPSLPQPCSSAAALNRTAAAAGPPRQLRCGLLIPCALAEGPPQPQNIHEERQLRKRGPGGASHVLVWHGAKLLPAEKATGEGGLPARLWAGQPADQDASDSHVLSDTSAPSARVQQPAVLRLAPADPAQA